MQTTRRSKQQRKSFRDDESAVSPVIGVIMLIAITVVIAAVVAAFAYGIIGGVASAPNAAMVIENARDGETEFIVVHHGGDTITEAFTVNETTVTDVWGVVAWDNLVVKVDGVTVNATITAIPSFTSNVIEGGDHDPAFSAGEQLTIAYTLSAGSTITIVYAPTDDVLQRVKVT